MQKALSFLISVIIAVVLLNCMFYIAIALIKTAEAYKMVWEGRLHARPGAIIAESVDSFLIAIFFIIFAIGIAKLFLPPNNLLNRINLPWLKVDSFSALKLVMWETLLTTLLVYYVIKAVASGEELQWTTLVLPAGILMLAIAYFLMKKGH